MKRRVFALVMVSAMCAMSACSVFSPESWAQKQRYSTVYADVSKEMTEIASSSGGITQTALKEAADMGHVASTSAFLYFVSELYKSVYFVVSDRPVTFTCSYKPYGESYFLAFRPVLEEENDRVFGEFYVETTRESGETECGYINIDVAYDFSEEEILAFDLYMCDWETADNVLYSKYQDGKLYKLDGEQDEVYEAEREKVAAAMAEFATAMESSIKLLHDFTREYTASMNALFGE